MSRKRYLTSSHTLAEILKGNGVEAEEVRDGHAGCSYIYRPTPAVQWVLREVRSSSSLSSLSWREQDEGGE